MSTKLNLVIRIYYFYECTCIHLQWILYTALVLFSQISFSLCQMGHLSTSGQGKTHQTQTQKLGILSIQENERRTTKHSFTCTEDIDCERSSRKGNEKDTTKTRREKNKGKVLLHRYIKMESWELVLYQFFKKVNFSINEIDIIFHFQTKPSEDTHHKWMLENQRFATLF